MFQHNKTEKIYFLDKVVKFQCSTHREFDDQYMAIYRDTEGNQYARLLDEFNDRFTRLESM
jgi:hypothetical protein